MAMDEEQIEREIKENLSILQSYEDIDPAYLDERRKELRHKVMHTHLRMERSLEMLISEYVITPFYDEVPVKYFRGVRRHRYEERMETIFDEMDYVKKVELAYGMKLIDSAFKGQLHEVNTSRKYFSHPKSYQDKIGAYREPSEYLRVLKLLVEVHRKMNTIFAEREKKWKEEDLA